MALSDQQKIRLIKLLGMLGSDYDGEVANAGRMANDIVKSSGLDWSKIIGGSTVYVDRIVYREKPISDHPSILGNKVAFIFKSGITLTEWEATFLNDIKSRARLTEKQERIFNELYAKAEARKEAC